MPIHSGADNIDRLKIGSVLIASAYVGVDKVFGYDPTQILTLTSADDLNLATWLGAQGADPAKPIIINFASDQTIGGTITDKPALELGDLSAYSGITFNVNGKILGRATGDAVWAQNPIDIINGGTVSGAVEDGVDTGDSEITFVIGATGEIRAGGGNGGAGGKGGTGDDVTNWSGYVHSATTTGYFYRFVPDTCHWAGVAVANSYSPAVYAVGFNNSYRYQRGDWVNDGGPEHTDQYYIRRGTYLSGVGGAGGLGGSGAGYTQAQEDGFSGLSGTYRSGTGGKGGDGGDWGVSGGEGARGGSGLYYSTTSSSAVRAGTAGVAGTDAGNAFKSSAVILIL